MVTVLTNNSFVSRKAFLETVLRNSLCGVISLNCCSGFYHFFFFLGIFNEIYFDLLCELKCVRYLSIFGFSVFKNRMDKLP